MKKYILITILFFTLLSSFPEDKTTKEKFKSSIITDWENSIIKLKVKTAIGNNLAVMPKEKLKAERLIDRNLTEIFINEAKNINYDHYLNLKDFIINETEILSLSQKNIFNHKKKYAILSKDFKNINIEYEFNIFPNLSKQILKHKYPVEIPRTIMWIPTEKFSGIVIYAKGQIDSHGENKSANLNPAIFPRIFDEKMNLIFDKAMMSPEIINKHGMVAYTNKMDLKKFSKRIGLSPLKTSAIKVFGDYYTDIIISSNTAEKILYSENNRKLLKDGKVLIICDLK